MQKVMRRLRGNGVGVVIYEPSLQEDTFWGFKVIGNIEKFKEISDVIAANRITEELVDVDEKVYTQEIYGRD